MQAIIRYPNAERVEVLVLSAGRFTMRVLAPGSADTTELKFDYGQWTDETGIPIEFESLLVDSANRIDTRFAVADRALALFL